MMVKQADIKNNIPEHLIPCKQNDVLLLRCAPISVVRIAFIGLGRRGKQSLNNYVHLEGVEIKAVCDLKEENLSEARRILEKYNKNRADEYTAADAWKKLCERSDIDLVYVCTSINLHAEIAVYAMENGKHVATEVPIANTIADCWKIVNAAEKHRRHCIMLENCCYGRFELAALNMCSKGLFGDIIHAEGGYIHDLRNMDFDNRPDYTARWQTFGNPYPTHGLGPVCQALNIHRGDRLSWLVSVSNRQFCFPQVSDGKIDDECTLGNINTTIIKTAKEKTIVLQHDISSPRPYSRNYMLSGTKGFIQKEAQPVMKFENAGSDEENTVVSLLEKYEHPFYKAKGEQAVAIDTHEGMDFIMDYRLIYCLQNGLPLDMDVYDAVEWSSIVELTAQSIRSGNIPVAIPDFTRGAWNKLSGLSFAE